MRSSRLCSSFLALATLLGTTSVLAAPVDPPPPPTPLEPSGKQPDPPAAEVAAPNAPEVPPPGPVPNAKPKVLEVPAFPPPPPPPPPALPPPQDYDSNEYAKHDHFEFTMGFLAGQRSYSDSSFKFEDGSAEGIGGGGLVKPFARAPFDKATVLGLRYDVRLVMSYIRMTVGFDVPFPTYKVSGTTVPEDVNGTLRQVTVQSLSAKELRFGIGAEYPFTKVAIFADLIGGVHWVDSELAIDGYKANYAATNFAFSGRAGLRGYVRKWFFVTATGEAGLVGDLVWNAEVAVGFASPGL